MFALSHSDMDHFILPMQHGQQRSNLLKDRLPDLFVELHQRDNPGVDLSKITVGSLKKYMWRCSKHTTCDQHVWSSNVPDRVKGNGCIFCSKHSKCKRHCACTRKQATEFELKIDPSHIKSKKEIDQCLQQLAEGSEERKKYLADTFKTCKRCQSVKTIAEFYIKDNKILSQCQTCGKSKAKNVKNIKNAMMKLFFANRSCFDCGETNVTVLECDHIDDNKSVQKNGKKIPGLVWNSTKNLPNELRKCQVVCCFCHRLRTTLRYALNKPICRKKRVKRETSNEYVNACKLKQGKCLDCQRAITPVTLSAFDFDHIDSEKKVERLSRMALDGEPEEKLQAEIDKCQLVCANCHRMRTAKRAGWRTIADFPEAVLAIACKNLGDLVLPDQVKS